MWCNNVMDKSHVHLPGGQVRIVEFAEDRLNVADVFLPGHLVDAIEKTLLDLDSQQFARRSNGPGQLQGKRAGPGADVGDDVPRP